MNNKSHMTPIVWTIAGSDSGGGAGVQADLHTCSDFSVHGCTVITAVTAQNSMAVKSIDPLSAQVVNSQIQALSEDLPAQAVKLGMLANIETVIEVSNYLASFSGALVCDPVLSASTGGELLSDQAMLAMKERLFPRIDVLTPNIPEAQILSGITINNRQDVPMAASALLEQGVRSVLITGGHDEQQDDHVWDYWSNGSESFWLKGERIDSDNTHGSGCTLSMAIAAMLARGAEVADAIVVAKAYVTQGIRKSQAFGDGAGPVAHHGWPHALDDFPGLYSKLNTNEYSFPDCMMSGERELGLYPVVDSADWIEKLAPLGISTIQLRIKDVPDSTIREHIIRAKEVCEKHNVRLFVNDYWQLAIEHGVYGVHLGQEDLDVADLSLIAAAGLRLGVSTHSYYEIARAHGIKPSYIALGPVYSTTTKAMKFSPLGVDQVREWTQLLQNHYPLTAIGGISVERTKGVLSTGVKSCAMVTAITQANDYKAEVEKLLLLHRLAD